MQSPGYGRRSLDHAGHVGAAGTVVGLTVVLLVVGLPVVLVVVTVEGVGTGLEVVVLLQNKNMKLDLNEIMFGQDKLTVVYCLRS